MLPKGIGSLSKTLCPPPDYVCGDKKVDLQEIITSNDYEERLRLLQLYLLGAGIGERCRIAGSHDTYVWLIPFVVVERLAMAFGYKKGSIEFLVGKNYDHAVFVEVIVPDKSIRFFDIVGLLKVIYYLGNSNRKWRDMFAPKDRELDDTITILCNKLRDLEEATKIGVRTFEP